MQGAWIDLEDREIQLGMTYVALSRLTSLQNCVLEDHEFERLKKCRLKDMQQLVTEEKRLRQLQSKTLKKLQLHDKSVMLIKISEDDDAESDDEDDDLDLMNITKHQQTISGNSPDSIYVNNLMQVDAKEMIQDDLTGNKHDHPEKMMQDDPEEQIFQIEHESMSEDEEDEQVLELCQNLNAFQVQTDEVEP